MASMRTVSAAEAGRDFAALVDAAERGETVLIERGGKLVAQIGPAPVRSGRMSLPSGAALAELQRRHLALYGTDRGSSWADDINDALRYVDPDADHLDS